MWKLKTSILSFALFGILFIGVNSQYNSRYDDDFDDIEYDDTLNVNDPNVCTVQVFRTGYYWKNESYSCRRYEVCTPQEQAYLLRQRDCSSSYLYNSYSCRRLRNNCQVSRYTTCWRRVLRCEPRWETEKYCCSGCVPNGKGGCTRSVQCGNNNGGCGQRCTYNSARNTAVCSCLPGYRLATDGRTCIDINECATNNGGCNQQCKNIEKGFYCTCNNGFRLSSPLNCTDIQECAVGNGGCQHTCHNTRGRFYCECRPGYTRVNGFNCVDTDECKLHNGGCSDRCVNLEPGYRCECEPGKSLAPDNKTCNSNEAANPCSVNNGNCSQTCNAVTLGGGALFPICSCRTGFTLAADDKTCIENNGARPGSGLSTTPGAGPDNQRHVDDRDVDPAASGFSAGPAVGGVIGALLIIILILLIIVFVVRRRRHDNDAQRSAAVQNRTYGQNGPSAAGAAAGAGSYAPGGVYDELSHYESPVVSGLPLPPKKGYPDAVYDNGATPTDGKMRAEKGNIYSNAGFATDAAQPPPYAEEDDAFGTVEYSKGQGSIVGHRKNTE